MTRAFEGRAVNGGHRLVLRNARAGHLLVKCWRVSCDRRKSPRSGGPATAAQQGRDPLPLPNWEGDMKKRSARARFHQRGRVNFENINRIPRPQCARRAATALEETAKRHVD
jgi:hypothetical protein